MNPLLARADFRAMGCPCAVQADTPAAVDAARAVVDRLEARYSRFRDDSLVAAINASAGNPAGIRVDAETARLLDVAATAHDQSDGRFDITAGVLRNVWDWRSGRLPDADAVAACVAHVGWQHVDWTPPVLRLPAGMAIDLGGLVKEYAADAAAAAARDAGAAHGLVDLGGDLAVIGPNPDGTPWQIGIRDPWQADQAVATLALAAGGLASSGNYERCITVDGKRYGHILEPRTGWPPDRGFAAVSVVADACLVAGLATTVAMVAGVTDGLAWLDELGLDYLAIDEAGRRYTPTGSSSGG